MDDDESDVDTKYSDSHIMELIQEEERQLVELEQLLEQLKPTPPLATKTAATVPLDETIASVPQTIPSPLEGKVNPVD